MRVLYCLTHPIQYQSPLIRHLRGGGLDLEVIYATDTTSRAYFDPGFGKSVTWDVPLLDGCPHVILNREEPAGDRSRQLEHYQQQLFEHLARHPCDALWVHGWAHPFAAAAWRVAAEKNIPLMLRGETFRGCIRGGWLRRLVHRLVFTWRFRKVAAFLAVGMLNHSLYRAYGVPETRIFQVPYAVDNTFFQAKTAEARPWREKLRAALGIEPDRPIILFCGKLTEVKDPATLIQAVGRMNAKPMLLLAGDGVLRQELEQLASRVAAGSVKFLGFQNQTELPALYDLCDVFVLPSIFEPWGLVVNEVMNAGKPVIVSDQVGAGPDLVRAGINGDIFQAGDVADLVRALKPFMNDAVLRLRAGEESLRIINQWGFAEDLNGMKQALAFIST